MFAGHYEDWIQSRVSTVQKYISSDFFRGKTLLELGCGYADIGEIFRQMGAVVTSSDARGEHLLIASQKHPELKTLLLDCDTTPIPEKYDIILHWGVLYHLREIENHLQSVCENCDVLLLETEVCDSTDPNFYIPLWEKDEYDQAYNRIGIRPSPPYVEKILHSLGFSYQLITDGELNTKYHIYNWENRNTGGWEHGQRRFWICWKGVCVKNDPNQTK